MTLAQTPGSGGGATPNPPPGTRVSKPNWYNSMGRLAPDGVCVLLEQNHILRIELIVRFAKQDINPYPNLHIEYDFGGILEGITVPITNADLQPISFYGTEIYQYAKIYDVFVDDFCGIPDNITEFPFTYSLVTMDDETEAIPLPYPVLSYPDLFPPALFTELLDPTYTPVYSGTKTLCCYSQAGLTSEEAASGPTIPVSIKVTPNPFRDALTFDLVVERAQRVQMELINLQGQTVFQLERSYDSPGAYRERLDLQALPTGVYICRFNSPEHNQSIKVLKID